MRSGRSIWIGAIVGALIGASSAHGQFWEVDNRVLTGDGQQNAFFGLALAIGDFDDDGFNDLVVGAPFWDSATVTDLGQWHTYRGSADRALSLWGHHTVGAGDSQWAGHALAAGDFDGDGRDEIAIGRPAADVDDGGTLRQSAGAVTIGHNELDVWVFPQSLSELDAVGSDGVESFDQFGSTLTVGNFNGDAYEDLVVGAPDEGWLGDGRAGAVHVFYGAASGLRTDNAQTFAAGDGGVLGTRGETDFMGEALAAGDFDDDGYDDLAIGAPDRKVDGTSSAGQVHVLYGSALGLTLVGQQLFSEDDFPGSFIAPETRFGAALAAGNFDEGGLFCVLSSCYDDLAIGIPGWDFLSTDKAGRLVVAYGSAAGIVSAGSTNLHQLNNGDYPEALDFFGSVLAAGHVDRQPGLLSGSYHDLVVGAYREDYATGLADDGLVQLFFGATAGLDQSQQEQLIPLRDGFGAAPANSQDWWGWALAVGDLDGDRWGDRVVGVPYVGNSAFVQVLYGAMFADGFERGSSGGWSATTN